MYVPCFRVLTCRCIKRCGNECYNVLNIPSKNGVPQVQPSVEGQPYRSFPHFNVMGVDGNTGAISRPDSAVVKIIMMTMNDWPMLEEWLSVRVVCNK